MRLHRDAKAELIGSVPLFSRCSKHELVVTREPDDYIGEIALLERSPRTATVTTTSAVRALVVSGRDFWSPLDTAPGLQRKLLETLAERLAPTEP